MNRPTGFRTSIDATTLSVACVVILLVIGCPSPPGPPPPGGGLPKQYTVDARGTVELGDARIPGGARIDYLVNADNTVSIRDLHAWMADLDIVTRVIGIETDRDRLRCTEFSNTEPIGGRLVTGDRIEVGRSAAKMSGLSYSRRGADRSCTGMARLITAENDRALRITHDPVGDRFAFNGVFVARHDGETYRLAIDIAGSFVNRPPIALIGVGGPELPPDLIQGGCPPLTGINPPTAEANDPGGLRLNLLSVSYDPDGSWGRSDVSREQWARSIGGPFQFLGEGRLIGPVLFEFGPQHQLQLTIADRRAARARQECEFIVADTTPPEVTTPAAITVPCSVPGGATPDTSPDLAAFLAAGSAVDIVDASPTRLQPQVDGADVTGSTLFPIDRSRPPDPQLWTEVLFRYRDRFANQGARRSAVRVYDRYAPRLEFILPVAVTEPNLRFVTLRPSFELVEECGGVRLILESIVSNAPELDAEDIRDAEFGQDDRSFELRARPAIGSNQLAADRKYVITYVAADDAGNEVRVSRHFVVRAEGPR